MPHSPIANDKNRVNELINRTLLIPEFLDLSSFAWVFSDVIAADLVSNIDPGTDIAAKVRQFIKTDLEIISTMGHTRPIQLVFSDPNNRVNADLAKLIVQTIKDLVNEQGIQIGKLIILEHSQFEQYSIPAFFNTLDVLRVEGINAQNKIFLKNNVHKPGLQIQIRDITPELDDLVADINTNNLVFKIIDMDSALPEPSASIAAIEETLFSPVPNHKVNHSLPGANSAGAARSSSQHRHVSYNPQTSLVSRDSAAVFTPPPSAVVPHRSTVSSSTAANILPSAALLPVAVRPAEFSTTTDQIYAAVNFLINKAEFLNKKEIELNLKSSQIEQKLSEVNQSAEQLQGRIKEHLVTVADLRNHDKQINTTRESLDSRERAVTERERRVLIIEQSLMQKQSKLNSLVELIGQHAKVDREIQAVLAIRQTLEREHGMAQCYKAAAVPSSNLPPYAAAAASSASAPIILGPFENSTLPQSSDDSSMPPALREPHSSFGDSSLLFGGDALLGFQDFEMEAHPPSRVSSPLLGHTMFQTTPSLHPDSPGSVSRKRSHTIMEDQDAAAANAVEASHGLEGPPLLRQRY